MISKEEVKSAQKRWADGIVYIGKLFSEKKDYKKAAAEFVDDIYGFDERTILFKPTKAREIPFRHDKEGAISYFVSGNEKYPEDLGFAIQPCVKVEFRNMGFILKEKEAITMGNYIFIDDKGNETLVEYSMGFFIAKNGKLKLYLHHSSFPFNPLILG